MQYVVSNQQMKEAERRCNESGTSYYQMMENAGTRCAEFILGTIPVSADILVMRCCWFPVLQRPRTRLRISGVSPRELRCTSRSSSTKRSAAGSAW